MVKKFPLLGDPVLTSTPFSKSRRPDVSSEPSRQGSPSSSTRQRPVSSSRRAASVNEQLNVSHGSDASGVSARSRNKRNAPVQKIAPEVAAERQWAFRVNPSQRPSEPAPTPARPPVTNTQTAPIAVLNPRAKVLASRGQLQRQASRHSEPPSATRRAAPRTATVTTTATELTSKRPKKRRLGIIALREIKHYQKTTNLLLRKLPFARLVRQICLETFGPRAADLQWQAVCFMAIQEAAEAFLISLMESAQMCAIHARRITIMPRDFHLVARVQQGPTLLSKW